MLYGYNELLSDIENVGSFFSIGKSFFGRDIWAIIKGEGQPRLLIHGAIHARESVTAALIVEMIKNYYGPAICFIPMVNPDGVELCIRGLLSAPEFSRNYLLKINADSDFSLWKANGRAVDLNVNFDADWGGGQLNVRYPSPANYVGRYPESEKETQALTALTKKYGFSTTLSLHTKGEIIYYGFKNCKSYINYAKIIADELNYPLRRSVGSSGGYKDWYLTKDLGMGLTVELGSDDLIHPIGIEETSQLYKKCRNLPVISAEIAEEIWKKNL